MSVWHKKGGVDDLGKLQRAILTSFFPPGESRTTVDGAFLNGHAKLNLKI
jgi:hypothetical protein